MAKEKLNFTGLDVAAFTGKTKSAWEKYRSALSAAQKKIEPIMAPVNADREQVEVLVTAALRAMGQIGPGQDVRFAYRFDGMAFAVQDGAAGTTSKSKKLVLQSGK